MIIEVFLDDLCYFDNVRNMEMSSCPPLPLENAAAKFAALGSEQRLSVLQSLVRAGPEGLSMGELGARCGITGSTLTHHLKILSAAGLVAQAKQGRSIICVGAAYEEIRVLSEFLLNECCSDAPTKDHDYG